MFGTKYHTRRLACLLHRWHAVSKEVTRQVGNEIVCALLFFHITKVQYYSETKQRWMETTVIRIYEQALIAKASLMCLATSDADVDAMHMSSRKATFATTSTARRAFLLTRSEDGNSRTRREVRDCDCFNATL